MPKPGKPQAHKAGGFQVGKSKLLRTTESGVLGGGSSSKGSKPVVGGSSAKRQRDDAQKQLASLHERTAAKSFKRPPAPKLVLAAPIFDLPTKQELLLRPLPHPMDMLLFNESDAGKSVSRARAPKMQTSAPLSIQLAPAILTAIAKDANDDGDDLL
jgi:hypothetical protein